MEDVWTVPMHEHTRPIKFVESIAANVFPLLNNDDRSSLCGITFRDN